MIKPGDLVQDHHDGEIGLVVSVGPGYEVGDCVDYPDGIMPSWKIDWPSIPYVCDLGEDALTEGLVEIISKS
jgi:hypothetical protein